MYNPMIKNSFNTAAELHKATPAKVNGITTKNFTPTSQIFYCSVKSYGGTEIQINNVLAVEDTRIIICYFDPSISVSDCLVFPNESADKWEIITPPENIDLRNQYLQFKVKRIRGGA